MNLLLSTDYVWSGVCVCVCAFCVHDSPLNTGNIETGGWIPFTAHVQVCRHEPGRLDSVVAKNC